MSDDNENKKKARDEALKILHKEYGKDSVNLYSQMEDRTVETLSSGSFGLDIALGGGWGRGRIVEIYGPQASGKTTLTLHAIAECQKQGGVTAFIDAEHALDPVYARNIGVDMDEVVFSQPSSGEEGLNIASELIRSDGVDMVVVDSVAALVPKKELDGKIGDTHVGLQARMMSQALRRLASEVSQHGAILIFINQTRDKIGVMFGKPTTTPGGKALKYAATQRVEIARIAGVKSGDEMIANRTRCKVDKNKIAPPFRQCEFEITFGKGINRTAELLDFAIKHDIIKKSGAWFSYKGDNVGQGREKTISWLDSDLATYLEIEEQVLEAGYGDD